MLSQRIRKFHALIRAAHEQPSSWLVAVLKTPERPGNLGPMPALSRLACLRILVGRHPSGLPYPWKKRLVRQELGI